MQTFIKSSFYPPDTNIKILPVNFPIPIVKNIDITDIIKKTQTKQEDSNHYVLLTRPDIFPSSFKDLYKIYFTSVGEYSATPFDINKMMVDKILEIIEQLKINYDLQNPLILFDGTASTGADVVDTIYNWPNKNIKIIASELDPLNFKCLQENIKLFNYEKNVTLYNKDSVLLLKEIKNPLNILYFDPPWGGKDYKQMQKLDLYLGGKDIFELSLEILNEKMVKNHVFKNVFLIVLKVPKNYNDSNKYLKQLEKLTNIISFEYRNIKYLFIISNTNKLDNNVDNKMNIDEAYKKLTCNNIVSLDELKDYLQKGNLLLNDFGNKRKFIEIQNTISIMEKRHTKYVSPNVNKQFITIGIEADVVIRNRLFEMLDYFIGTKSAEMVFFMISNNKLDNEILDFIKQYHSYDNYIENTIYKISKISDKIHKYTKHISKPKILDVGTGSGKKIKTIQSLIDCEIYGADVEKWGPYQKDKKFNFPFKIIQESPYKIPYENNMFDCITLILTLHHCNNIIDTINECKRILKDDGIIVIVEHDIWSDYDHMIIDIQHRIYSKIYNENDNQCANYYNFYEWDIIFNKCQMTPIYADRISESADFRIRYDLQFIGVYKKLDNDFALKILNGLVQ